tara:strand:- start:21 stop:287 length:267 start_codon:yes stop_codon:yes gene_type:complete
MSCKKFSFNNIANVISIVSGVSLAGIIGVGSYVYLNKDAIIDDIKDAAIESVVGGMGGGALGAPDLAPPSDSAAALTAPSGGLGVPTF